MKSFFIYSLLILVATTTEIIAQELSINSTTIQKIGPTELKVNVQQATKKMLIHAKSDVSYRQQWKEQNNGITEIEFNKDVVINAINIKAGKYFLLLFPGNDWKPANDVIYAFPGNDWQPKDNALHTFPGNDWNPKNSKVKFPGNDWKPKKSKIKFPGNDWTPVNELMESFPGNDWLVVFYKNTGKANKKLDKNLIVAEVVIDSKRQLTPTTNLAAHFIYLNTNSVQLELSWKKTLLSIPINIK